MTVFRAAEVVCVTVFRDRASRNGGVVCVIVVVCVWLKTKLQKRGGEARSIGDSGTVVSCV